MKPDVVVVTGAGRGIGRSVCIEIAKNEVPLLCISKSESVYDTVKEAGKYTKAESIQADIVNFDKTTEEIKKWLMNNTYKRIGVVLAASVLGDKFEVENFNAREWSGVMNVNLTGNFNVLGALLPRMLENKYGRIVAFSGGGSAYAYPIFSAYSASKTAVVRTVENFAEVLKDKGDFAIAALAPGAVETDMLKKVRSFGAEVKTTVNISEPTNFVKEFIFADKCNFSGSFVHVRDEWPKLLNSENQLSGKDMFKLRRIEK
ncbi:MAG: SDR family oxidoreductase [Ignavibacteria bacterium]